MLLRDPGVPIHASGSDFADRLPADEGLAVLPGTASGPRGEYHLRLALTAPVPVLEQDVHRLANGVQSVIDHHQPES